ncbi:hypothetical protein K2Y00_01110 [Patescibacteria group bacterium]|nr:hypothetical protein [Patescibacteria group bacterium]
MANWIDRWKNPAHKQEHPPAPLGTEEYIELSDLSLADVYTRLKEKGVQFAGRDDLRWIKANPDKAEAQGYKRGGEFYFFAAGNGHYVEQLRWDREKGEFKEETIYITGMTAPIIWGDNRDKANAIPRRVVIKR